MQFTAENTIMKSMSFSFGSNYKKTSIKHNERKPEDKGKLKDFGKHIHWDKTKDNLVLVSKPIKEVYRDVFQKSVDEYNKKQRRKDRKIKNFYSKMRKDKSYDAQKEFIIQVGKKGQQLSDNPTENERLQKLALKEYLEKFEETYPQLHIYSAVVHVDEASPHLHLAVVPEATGYKRGVAKKPSFSKALGITSQDDFKEFCEANRNLLQQSVQEVLGEGVKVEREKVGTHTYLPPEQYRELMAKADAKVQKAQDTLDDAKDQADSILAKAKDILDDAEDKASDILAKAKADAEKIASDARTKADANREVMRYRASELSKVDREVESKKSEKLTQVDREVVAYKDQEKSKVDREVVAYSDKKRKEAETDADQIRKDAKFDASLILSDAKSKRTDAVARENAVAGREADISAREAVLQANESKYTDDLELLQKRQQELDKKEKEIKSREDALAEKENKFTEQVKAFWKKVEAWTFDRLKLKKLNEVAKKEQEKPKPEKMPQDVLDAIAFGKGLKFTTDAEEDKGLQQ